MKKSNIEQLKEVLNGGAKKIVVTSHLNPDGDAVGSSLALCEWLKIKGHKATVVLPNEAPKSLHFTKGFSTILHYTKQTSHCERVIGEADIIFAVDYNDIATRIGRLGDYLVTKKDKYKILIDHHLSPPEGIYDIMFSDPKISSTSLLVSNIIRDMGEWDKVTISLAENIYLGMMTDTGNFSFGHLTAEVYRTIADLVDIGVSPVDLNIAISHQQRKERLQLMGFALYEKMVILPELKSAYMWLTAEELTRMNFVEGDLESVVNIPLTIEGIENSAIFIDKGELIKISLRSMGAVGLDMNSFARKYFIGGGHRNAAGAKSFETMQKTIDNYIEGLKIELNKE